MVTTLIGLEDGTITAVLPCKCISNDLLQEILIQQENGMIFTDIIDRLRPRTVPSGYSYHRWNTGMLV